MYVCACVCAGSLEVFATLVAWRYVSVVNDGCRGELSVSLWDAYSAGGREGDR